MILRATFDNIYSIKDETQISFVAGKSNAHGEHVSRTEKRDDISVLKTFFKEYEMEYPECEFYCTLIASRRCTDLNLPNHQLHTVAAACGFNLENHHHALADAEACAAIALKLL